MSALRTQTTHRPITPLGTWTACGGVGGVYDIAEDSDVVYKEVNPAFCSDGRRRKVAILAEIGRGLPAQSPLRTTVAWPIDAVEGNGKWRGFTMRKVCSARSLEDICADAGVSSSMRAQVGLQMAEIIRNIHLEGLVIGDLSCKNWLYDSSNMRLTLIDPDSFQVAVGNEVFATSESLELSFEMATFGKKRPLTSRSDDFLYAVALHRLLFLAHPLDDAAADTFSRNSSIRTNVEQRRYPYLDVQKPLALNVFGEELKSLFVRTFTGDAETIPSVTDYLVVLRKIVIDQGFQTCLYCGFDFSQSMSRCPACGKAVPMPKVSGVVKDQVAKQGRKGRKAVRRQAEKAAENVRKQIREAADNAQESAQKAIERMQSEVTRRKESMKNHLQAVARKARKAGRKLRRSRLFKITVIVGICALFATVFPEAAAALVSHATELLGFVVEKLLSAASVAAEIGWSLICSAAEAIASFVSSTVDASTSLASSTAETIASLLGSAATASS